LQIKQEKHNYLSRTSEWWPQAHNHPPSFTATHRAHFSPLFPSLSQRIQQNKCQSAHRQKNETGEDCLCRAYKSGSKFWATTKTQIFSIFFNQFLRALEKILPYMYKYINKIEVLVFYIFAQHWIWPAQWAQVLVCQNNGGNGQSLLLSWLFYLAKDGGHIVIIIIWKTQWRLHAQKAATLLLGVAKCFCAAILV